MTKKEKLLDSVKRNPRNVTLNKFESLVKFYGYIQEGSRHPKVIIGIHTLPYKRENPVKSCYVVELLDIIEEQGL